MSGDQFIQKKIAKKDREKERKKIEIEKEMVGGRKGRSGGSMKNE